MGDFNDIDIAKTIKQIDGLKVELLEHAAALFRGFVRGSESVLVECLANILITAYLLGNRLGISFSEIDRQASEILKRRRDTSHEQNGIQTEMELLEEHINSGR